MHGEHAHLVAVALVEIALDLDRAGGEPMQETLERRDMRPLIGEGEGEELVERVGGFRAEPTKRGAPSATRRENIGIELVRRDEIGAAEQGRELVSGMTQSRIAIGVLSQ